MNMKNSDRNQYIPGTEPIAVFLLLHPCDECERFQSASRQV